MKRILFVCKRRNVGYSYNIPYGLLNSARFVSEALHKYGIESKVVDVVDGNGIDREVYQYRPTHVMLEAIWVTPAKVEELLKLWPKVQWVVRGHSKAPFVALEGIAIEWMGEYAKLAKKYKNFKLSSNSIEFNEETIDVLHTDSVYLPNIYQAPPAHPRRKDSDGVLSIGCFGAIRPLKNQLLQAIAAIKFADELDKPLEFHINSDRMEQRGEQVLKNLRALFAVNPRHKLVEHSWMKHAEFVRLVATLDLGLQVSLTESFNIVTADFVGQGVPVVVSPDITWMTWFYMADPNSSDDIVKKMKWALFLDSINFQVVNKIKLWWYNRGAIKAWLEYLSGC